MDQPKDGQIEARERMSGQHGRWAVSLVAVIALCWVSTTVATDEEQPARASLADFECPNGTESRQESSDGLFMQWCEAGEGDAARRHGPYLERFDDGSPARRGTYEDGLQSGEWVRFTADGEVESKHTILPGEASVYLPEPLDVCPPKSHRVLSLGCDDEDQMWMECRYLDKEGLPEEHGPSVKWDKEHLGGATRYLLREIAHYEDGRRHGRRLVFDGAFGAERVVEEETFERSALNGESRAYYLDGSLREIRHYRNRQLHGERIAFYADGRERWRMVYENDKLVSQEGDLTVADRACPEGSVPTTTASGLEDRCARRTPWAEEDVNGPFLRRNVQGDTIESGLYKDGFEVELWHSVNGRRLPEKVSPDTLVAEATYMSGDRPVFVPGPSERPPDPTDILRKEVKDPTTRDGAMERFLARHEELRQWHPESSIHLHEVDSEQDPDAQTEFAEGRLKIYGLRPGRYCLHTTYDRVRDNEPMYPGDLRTRTEFEVVDGEVTRFEAPMLYTLRLLKPWDNNEHLPGWTRPCGDAMALPLRPRFVWQVPDGEDPSDIEWRYQVIRVTCNPYQELDVVAEGRTHELSTTLDLSPSQGKESYRFELTAWRGERQIGELMSFGPNGYGWNVRFRVAE